MEREHRREQQCMQKGNQTRLDSDEDPRKVSELYLMSLNSRIVMSRNRSWRICKSRSQS